MKKKKNSILRQIAKYILRGIGIIILIFLTWSMIPIRQTIRPIQKRAETKYWTMRDGSKIAYSLLKGDSANINPPIIYLHGGPGGYVHSAIIKQMDEVAKKGYDVYLYDQIGSGLSDRLSRPKDYSFERHLNDLKEIINSHIMSDKVILLGHSFGGILAVHFAARFPNSIDRLILSSPGDLQPYRVNADGTMADMGRLYPTPANYQFKAPIEVFEQTEKDFLQPRIVMSMFCALAFNIKWASDKEFDDYTNTMASKFTLGMVADPRNVKMEEGGAGGYSHGFSNYYGDLKDAREKLRNLNIPTLVMQGQYDQGEYSSVYEYVDLLKGNYIFIEDAGHIIWWDKPNEFNRSVIEFLMKKSSVQ
ncbi:MAG: alpha/beta hydrolase [Saprospiraceae bacterium]|nr:MAG: alpha/beta hydrolase [Candidatus Parvibacillus calidus]MBX2938297.1 alpha/beta hydrolase [Saprospiraceae bacterium]MBX7178785.1 alpha/beta hydrolase [Saprospiraceae bacterium]MCB0590221.1 alpha/beta hydrolase [Saprospiraceae bacterium]MCC7147735.1 alpha/beta hydrolase [Saprospiraceae bacterium]